VGALPPHAAASTRMGALQETFERPAGGASLEKRARQSLTQPYLNPCLKWKEQSFKIVSFLLWGDSRGFL